MAHFVPLVNLLAPQLSTQPVPHAIALAVQPALLTEDHRTRSGCTRDCGQPALLTEDHCTRSGGGLTLLPMTRHNEQGQPIGEDLGGWVAPAFPEPQVMSGRWVTLEPLGWEAHGPALFEAFGRAPESLWTYMPFGPFGHPSELKETVEAMTVYPDWLPYAIVVSGTPLGFASYLRIQPPEGVIEVGAITFAPPLQRTTAATEALYLMMSRAFDLGYRRCEWKCDALNEPSRKAGERLGFEYEGTSRQATHYKGRNRDTAWFAIIDEDWLGLDSAFQRWLSPDNFDTRGQQLQSLTNLRQPGIG